AQLSRAHWMQTRRRLGHRLDVTRNRRLWDIRRWRLRHGIGRRLRRRRLGYRIGTWRRRRLDLVLPGRNVLDRRLVRLFGGRGGRSLFLLALRRLGCLEELREWALTHARALARH